MSVGAGLISSCWGRTYQVSNMRDGTATVLGNGTVRDTTLVLQTQATFRDGTHNVPADAPGTYSFNISTMSPFMTVLHSRVAFQVSQSGAMFTLVALGTLLVSLLIAFWFSVRLQFRDKVRAKWPSRVRKELVRGNLTNYLSLLFVAVETVQLCEFAFHVIPQWDTVARGATFLAGNFSVAWTFWVFGSAILLWNIFTLLILSNIAQRINQSSIGHILLYPAEALLPLLGTVGYVPATTTLLAPLGCRYTPAVARMSALCEVECWTSARHWSMSIIGAVLIDLFVPMNLVTRVVWQDIGKNEIKWDGLFFATDHLIKFLLVLWQAFLQDSNKTLYLGGIFVVNLLFAIGVFLTKPCNVPWMPLYRSLASLLASWVALIGWIFAGMSLNPDYVVPITIAGWVVIIVGGLYVSHRMYPAKFIKERRRTIGAIFKLFRAFK
ncbi:uncharacterized protein EV422DRAFT_408677 [Fimicolochytrium jonesii]|uniref:uncharacterized protein n=1 Tax=Fimicolochytrium jonesii TaxID=1396493 RepID=UPI0022FE7D40|nr:uncharacterized protein EV422DRAFT_408677 [Fimicolochytrium jonesii]KAI8822653.1 hypothetical protein EV422DRAFT_408677 [Fimicolochytrium jonesii]